MEKKKTVKTNLVRILDYKIKKSKKRSAAGGSKFIFSCSHSKRAKKGEITEWINLKNYAYLYAAIPAGNYIINKNILDSVTYFSPGEGPKQYYIENLAKAASKKFL